MGFEIGKLTRLNLGYAGEADSRVIEIDVSEWLERFPDAVIVVQAVRPDTYKYFPATEIENGILRWQVNAGEVAIAGKGFVQIAAINIDTHATYRSRVVDTIIADSLEGFNAIEMSEVDPAKRWVDRTLRASEVAKESAKDAARSAELAKQAAANAGYMQFEIGEDGRLYMYKTGNVDIEFALEEGRLMVYEQA